jgi:hypothetical protein
MQCHAAIQHVPMSIGVHLLPDPGDALAMAGLERNMQALAAVVLAITGGAGAAQDAGLLSAPACRRALETLEAREASVAIEGQAARAALEAARRQAAVACLGGPDRPASAPARAAQPALTITPAPRPAMPTPRSVPGASALPMPAPRAAPPLTIATCDATGCWASDGTRLQRAGPNLLGPTGLCTTSGPFVQCPP